MEQKMVRYPNSHGTVFFLLLFLLLAGCSSEQEKDSQSFPGGAVTVETLTVVTTEVADQVEVMATVQAARQAVISSRVSGNIIALEVTSGSHVTKGQTLLQISAEEISAQLQQARAQLDQASRNLSRERKLLAQNAATPEAVKLLEDSLKIAEASYREARTMLDYTTVTAPFDGLITQKLVDIGDLATPGKPLLHIADESNLQIVADIPESLVANITLGMEMETSIPAAQLKLKGTVVEITPIADPRSRTVPIKLDINEQPALRSGQFARVILPGNTVETILVPPQSIESFGQMEKVFLLVDGRARLRLVRTGKHYGQEVEILSGLSAGDKLIISDDKGLRDSQPVNTLDPQGQ